MNLTEFLKLTLEDAEELLRQAAEGLSAENNRAKAAEDLLQKSMQSKQNG